MGWRDSHGIMYTDDFMALFIYEEVHSFPLSIKGKTSDIYIRRLSSHVCARYRRICEKAAFRAEMDGLVNAGKGTDKDWKSIKFPVGEVEYSEHFLLRNSLCDPDGGLLFLEDGKAFDKFKSNIKDHLANDILLQVLYFNKIISRPEGEEVEEISNEKKKTS